MHDRHFRAKDAVHTILSTIASIRALSRVTSAQDFIALDVFL